MKKIIIPILLILTIIFINKTYSATTYSGGDVNEDGTTDINDAKLIAKYIINKSKPSGFTADKDIADVNGDGNVKMNDVMLIAAGKVTAGVAPTGITLDKGAARIAKGANGTPFTATVKPDNAVDKTVTWTSSNTSVATVNSSGKITAVGPGATTITAKTVNGKKATASVVVTKEDIYASYEGTTLKYWIEQPESKNYTLTRIWVKSAYNQIKATTPVELTVPAYTGYDEINACANDQNRTYKMYSLRSAPNIMAKEFETKPALQNKAMIVINASSFVDPYWVPGAPCSWYATPPIPYYVNDGNVIRDSTDGRNYGRSNPEDPKQFAASTFGINEDNELKVYYFNNGNTASQIAKNQQRKQEVIDDKVKYTFAFLGYLIEDGEIAAYGQDNSQKDARQALCRINNNNYIVLSTTTESDSARYINGLTLNEVAQAFHDYGCEFAINLDGGGSEVFYYKDRNSDLADIKINGGTSYSGRYLGELMYFTEQ